MFHDRGLTELEETQRLLVAQADIQRSLCRLECARLREHLGWIFEVRKRIKQGRPLALIAGAVTAGWLATRGWRGLGKLAPLALFLLKWVRVFNNRSS